MTGDNSQKFSKSNTSL